MLPVQRLLASLQKPIIITLITPDQHEQSSEIVYQHQSRKTHSIREDLSFILPPKLDFYLLKSVAVSSNGLVCTASHPSTPDIIVNGQRRVPHYKYPNAKFGDVCVV